MNGLSAEAFRALLHDCNPPGDSNPAGFCLDLGATPEQMVRLERILKLKPPPVSELADRGLQSRLGASLPWPDIATPPSGDYRSVRISLGIALLMELAQRHRLCDAPQISPFLRRRAPIRHISSRLAADLRDAPLEVWPTIAAPYPAGLLLVTPQGAIGVGGSDEPVALLAIDYDATGPQLALRCLTWGWNGGMHSSSWSTQPVDPTSQLAWGVTAMLASDPALIETSPQPATGMIRNRSERPQPSWIRPPVRYVRSDNTDNRDQPRGSVRGHWRRAHRHRVWTGPMHSPERRLVEHWFPAMWCAGDEEAA